MPGKEEKAVGEALSFAKTSSILKVLMPWFQNGSLGLPDGNALLPGSAHRAAWSCSPSLFCWYVLNATLGLQGSVGFTFGQAASRKLGGIMGRLQCKTAVCSDYARGKVFPPCAGPVAVQRASRKSEISPDARAFREVILRISNVIPVQGAYFPDRRLGIFRFLPTTPDPLPKFYYVLSQRLSCSPQKKNDWLFNEP